MSLRLSISHIHKSYNNLEVLTDFSAECSAPGIYCVTAPSGAGKTTLFRLIMGLEKQDSGTIHFFDDSIHTSHKLSSTSGEALLPLTEAIRFSVVFQEDRLIEHLSPMANIALVLSKKWEQEAIRKELLCLLPEESLDRPVNTLSGGMRRRCAFLRAIMAPSDVVIMDEPFTGLDSVTKAFVVEYLLEHGRERLFLIATHDASDIRKLGAATLTV